jgi:GT2 family glycosyltransferase
LQRVLESVLMAARTAQEAGCLRLVFVEVVDNSTDAEYREQLARSMTDWPGSSDFFHLNYRREPGNRGFGAGHNSVIEKLDSDYHLVLNPDAELGEDALQVGLSFLENHKNVVLLSPRVLGGNGEQEFLCKRYPTVLALLLRGFAPSFICRLFRQRLDQYEMRDVCAAGAQADVVLASGCFMLVRTEPLQQVGGFDEDYFLYFEDFDLSLRLASYGRLVFDPAMQIVHHGGYAASKGMQHVKYFIRSGIRFFHQHGWRWI